MKVQFNIKFHTKYGESLWLCGLDSAGEKDQAAGGMPMKYLNYDYWTLELDLDLHALQQPLSYFYTFQNSNGERVPEYQTARQLRLPRDPESPLVIYDTWIATDAIENVFYTAPFQEVFRHPAEPRPDTLPAEAGYTFVVRAPLLEEHEVVCLLGNIPALSGWNTAAPVLLQQWGNDWMASLSIPSVPFSLEYKYGIYNKELGSFVAYEEKENRVFGPPVNENGTIILHDGFIRRPNNTWKGAGLAIPVFSLRSREGLGIGEFNDLKELADWAQQTGLKLIQILPVNDTTATFTWRDSYPYAAISAFALHPVYLNVETVAGDSAPELIREMQAEKERLNALPQIDYEAVVKLKIRLLKQLFDRRGKTQLTSKNYQTFFNTNRHWLQPYAVFCYLRDKYKTVDYSKWKTHSVYDAAAVGTLFKNNPVVGFYCFLQYHLHLQLEAAVAYAHAKGIVIKGDIPIGVYRYGCDTWVAPELYHMELQAGAPPDDFAVHGQNWGFPTYNWPRMQDDHFSWWRSRFEQMSHYFDAFRIDHILGFFRIWSIPLDGVQGIMGYFDPSIPLKAETFYERGIQFSEDRFCHPFVNNVVLNQVFGEKAPLVKKRFLKSENGFDYFFLPEFDSQRKIENWFTLENDPDDLKQGLLQLLANVLVLKQRKDGQTCYHPRFGLDKTISFQSLPHDQQDRLKALYIDYFFRRQDAFWKKESLKKLPELKAATNMLICGEDLGLVPSSVPEVMKELGILSLEIQRMPKQDGIRFFNPANAPYLSVVSPSTHDMSTIRGWWMENRALTQTFYNEMLHLQGEAPVCCEGWINREIIQQHLGSPAMWCICQLQDLLGMDDLIRRKDPEEERINIPADPHHYWRYRMHLPLTELMANQSFSDLLKTMITNSGR
ncbi:4-alpha-glucanotransferase [Niabella drilacis]|uniref:4-alpha-glucanotransferase n=1 Tax=Niabella drilacis (strain DSM 25811 / CCM 8410 / CCUG 62505 / LMG 26954 / E90) TaxID=1285928 RepID=A0A1G6Z218_NIADE|nr:4-alpha-glucanotransferase [Niabella drilacis]SDD96343.1 4-alpha-glucanotransferase [Niabella drilacis]